ncbi:MAG: hypothetical protein ACK55Z_07980, partial [bacterium]
MTPQAHGRDQGQGTSKFEEELDAVEEAPDAVRRRSPISLHDGGMEGKLTGGSSVQEIPLEEGKRRQVKAAMSALTMIWDNG